MGLGAKDHGLDRSPAEPDLAFQSIYPTLAWTEFTLLEDAVGLFDPLDQFTLLLHLDISWKPLVSFCLSRTGDGRKEKRTAQKEETSEKNPTGDHLFTRMSL